MSTIESARPQSVLATYSLKTVSLIGLCFVFSGATGLIYEVLWARMLGLVFGATTLAVSTVLAAFMGGLALGSALAGRWSARIKRPLRTYGLMEAGVALYALLVPFLFTWIDNIYALIYQQFHPGFFVFSVWRFLLSSLMLLVPTTLMGATLPVLSAALLRSPDYKANSITRLYTCNLAGAIGGTLVAGFVLLPSLGVRSTIYFAAIINIAIALVAVYADRNVATTVNESADVLEDDSQSKTGSDTTVDRSKQFWLLCAFASGFVTISTQVAWTRLLTMIIGSSTYAFSIVVALFLIGLSLGAWLIGKKINPAKLRDAVLKAELATAVSLFISLSVVNRSPGLLISTGMRFGIASWLGLLALQIMAAALIVLLPAFLMGTIMPMVLVWAGEGAGSTSVKRVGRAYAVNTIGAIAGAFSAGFVLIPFLGTKQTILFAAAFCVIISGLAYQPQPGAQDPQLRRAIGIGLSAGAIIVLFVFAPAMNLSDLSIGAYDSLIRVLAKTRGVKDDASAKPDDVHQLVMYKEGRTSTVSVRKDWDITSMAINGRTNASDRDDMPTQVMLAQVPILVAPNIRNGLIVGFATGVSAGAILQSPMESVTCVELEPATIPGSRFFEHVNHQPLNDPRFRLVIDDARTILRVDPTRYDVIMSEPSHPWVPGVANLFTEEFFTLGRDRLSEGGVFVQWLQIYQLSNESLRSILATYARVFPHVMMFRVGGAADGKDLILVGSKERLTLDHIAERMRNERIAAELARVNLRTEADVRSWYVCDESQLVPAVAGGVINTDDNMHIETTVPREAFRPTMDANGDWIKRLATH